MQRETIWPRRLAGRRSPAFIQSDARLRLPAKRNALYKIKNLFVFFLDAASAICTIELIQVIHARRRARSAVRGPNFMQIHISANDGVPIYLQIVNQVKYL